MLNRAEFEIGSKVNFWNGDRFVKTSVISLQLNPIKNAIEYRLFYREGTEGKRSRVYITTSALFIKESVHFDEKNN